MISAYGEKFAICLGFVLKWEKGKDDDPIDRGGRTKDGITQREYNQFLRNNGRPIADVWSISDHDRDLIYYQNYWVLGHCEEMDVHVSIAVFNVAVNSGLHRAIRELQQCLNVADDGLFGAVTAKALKLFLGYQILGLCIAKKQRQFYRAIVANDPTQAKFLDGWMNRNADLEKFLSRSIMT